MYFCRVDGYIDTLSCTSLPEPCGQLNCVRDHKKLTFCVQLSGRLWLSKGIEVNWNLKGVVLLTIPLDRIFEM